MSFYMNTISYSPNSNTKSCKGGTMYRKHQFTYAIHGDEDEDEVACKDGCQL